MSRPWDLETSSDPFNRTMTGYLGRQRETMLTNEILQKSRIGTAKVRGHQIPEDYINGASYRSPWNMSHALTAWAGVLPSLGPKVIREKGKYGIEDDYLLLNRAAVKGGMLTCPDVTSYRKTHFPIKISRAPGKEKKSCSLRERPPAKQHKFGDEFGIKLEPGPPIDAIITHQFQNCWIQDRRKKKKDPVEPLAKPPKNPTSVKTNLTTQLRMYMPPTGVESQPWRMKKFLSKAKPHLSTFRSDKELHAAMAANYFERQGRQGQTGQGGQRVKVHEHPLPPINASEYCSPGTK